MYLVEIVAYTGAGTETLRYSNGEGFVTAPGDTPASTYFAPRLKQPSLMRRDLFAGGTTIGRSRTGHGELILANDDGGLDALKDYAFDGRALTIYRGSGTEAFPGGWKNVGVYTMESVSLTRTEVRVALRDRQLLTDIPLQATKYAGDNELPDGLEGVADLKGKPKPICYGKVLNVSPPQVNTSKLIHQVNDGAVASVDAVYDSGLSLSNSPASWTERTAGATDSFGWCAYGDGIFVAGGGEGGLLTSDDGGETWTARTSTFGGEGIRRGVYSPSLDLWVIVGDNEEIATSDDSGETWTSRTSPFTDTPQISYVAWGNGKFVAIAANQEIAYSSDGTSWTLVGSTPFTVGGGVGKCALAFGRNLFVAQVCDAGTTAECATSPDGVTWTNRATAFSQNVSGIHAATYARRTAEGKGRFVFVGLQVTYSEDGLNWSRSPAPLGDGAQVFVMYGIDHGGPLNLFIAVGAVGNAAGKRIFVSVNGSVWASIDVGLQGEIPFLRGVAQSATDSVTVGDAGGGPDSVIYTMAAFSTYASEADLLDDDLQPDPGTFKAYLAGGYIRLGSTPAGAVTSDITQGASGADRTAGQLFTDVLIKAGLNNTWSTADITALDSANSSVIGFWSGTRPIQVSDLLTRMAQSVGAWWGIDRAGVFRIKQFTAPSGAAVHSFVADDMVKPLEKLPTRDRASIPVYRTTIRYGRNYTVQDGGSLAGAVTDVRRAILSQGWREETDLDATVQTKHLLAPDLIIETLLAEQVDAATETARVQTLRGADRDRYEFTVPLDDDTLSIDLGDVVEVTHSRFDLSGGADFRVITLDDNAKGELLLVGIWK